MSVSPLKDQAGEAGKSTRSLREAVLDINNEGDLNYFIASYASSIPPRPAEIKYERHPVSTPAWLKLTTAILMFAHRLWPPVLLQPPQHRDNPRTPKASTASPPAKTPPAPQLAPQSSNPPCPPVQASTNPAHHHPPPSSSSRRHTNNSNNTSAALAKDVPNPASAWATAPLFPTPPPHPTAPPARRSCRLYPSRTRRRRRRIRCSKTCLRSKDRLLSISISNNNSTTNSSSSTEASSSSADHRRVRWI